MAGAGGYDISASLSTAISSATNTFLDNDGSGINFGDNSRLGGGTFNPADTTTSAATTAKGDNSPASTNQSASAGTPGVSQPASSTPGLSLIDGFLTPANLIIAAVAVWFFFFRKGGA